ncbi:hypothetical protein TRFO_36080 [Tritrichomonas foetus]|uniref:E2F/DP family winged-helix DNA-binding domain-containing protein n=1 Tax=Tritrichomonas foetus TaxID=1144522 RepID=A0A1J4JF06_9EUKA|nr:hypothetical protein TRFO_36080 [Tritrichomonas foetus]|eukprot:OHS97680.1 hypothetical protein TRFO_36080 [Tritrichomonas foetus]
MQVAWIPTSTPLINADTRIFWQPPQGIFIPVQGGNLPAYPTPTQPSNLTINNPLQAPPIQNMNRVSQIISQNMQTIPNNNNQNSLATFQNGISIINNNQKSNDELKASIQLLIRQLESRQGEQSISAPSQALGIKRRRLYDVINVFESIGCCRKCALDSVIWIGKENIAKAFDFIAKSRKVDDLSKSISDIFPVHQCVGIQNLTTSFILLFFALRTDRLDLRFTAQFFSRNTSRYKTTLCKLYQVAYILAALDLTSKTSHVCEVVIRPDIFGVKTLDLPSNSSAVSIKSLLNGSEDELSSAITKRRNDFRSYYIARLKE